MTMRDPIPSPQDAPPAPVDKLALPTDGGAAPVEFDPVVGEEAFLEKQAELEKMPPGDVRVPTCDLEGAGTS